MRYFLAICLFILFALPVHAQKKKKNLPAEAKIHFDENVCEFIPFFKDNLSAYKLPSMVWIDTLKLLVDEAEIVNIHWLKFMASSQRIDKTQKIDLEWRRVKNVPLVYPYKEFVPNAFLMPDTTVWHEAKMPNSSRTYLRYPGFRLYPLVGVTKQQAEAFCAWRSSIVTENYNREGKGLARKYHVEITFRLPTEKEWEILAQGKNTNPHGFKQLNKKEHSKVKNGDNKMYWQGGERVNCKMPYDDSITSTNSYEGKIRYLEYIKTNPPTDYLLYNTIGNVAEMVQEEGIAKGGSWFHTLEESAIKERQIYTKPTAWLGFRCVATVKLTPKKTAR